MVSVEVAGKTLRRCEMTQAVNVTPTWSAVLPMLIMAIENGPSEGSYHAIQELRRMAEIADNWNEEAKKNSEVHDG